MLSRPRFGFSAFSERASFISGFHFSVAGRFSPSPLVARFLLATFCGADLFAAALGALAVARRLFPATFVIV